MSWFFEKIGKIDKTLSKLIKLQGENPIKKLEKKITESRKARNL